ncbi:MAG TPA: hypothetical protein VJI32_05240 [Candidatus Nanoarchaeia archaeon]|nr:hypothetical protein [Candidatus Nanoarchaeia archaeon]
MNHTTKVMFTITFLLSMTFFLGVVLSGGSFQDLTGSATLTGGVIAENCLGEECEVQATGCGDDRSGYACRIACYSDQDCDDTIAQTKDICRNPGTEYSVCVNKLKNRK